VTTNLTEQTNRINNTSNRILRSTLEQKLEDSNKNCASVSVETSFEDLNDVTDDEHQKKILLDMNGIHNHLDLPESKSTKVECGKLPNQPIVIKEEQNGGNIIALHNGNTIMLENHDAMTLESAYAADNDDETDHCGWEEENTDDVSALSDSFDLITTKKRTKDKKILSNREESLKNKKVRISFRLNIYVFSNSSSHALLFLFLMDVHPALVKSGRCQKRKKGASWKQADSCC
jgi:hypothetical protein